MKLSELKREYVFCSVCGTRMELREAVYVSYNPRTGKKIEKGKWFCPKGELEETIHDIFIVDDEDYGPKLPYLDGWWK